MILFIAANPRDTTVLKLAEECAEIERELKMTRKRDELRFESRWAVGIDDLMRHLTELDPAVIHFSGHGSGSAGLMLQDEHGQPQLVSARALAMMVAAATSHVRAVILNACFTTAHAEELNASVDTVVSVHGAIGDEAARAFAIRFYSALGNGRSVGNAVQQGIATLVAKRLPEVLPRCMARDGVDPDEIFIE